MSQPMTNEGQIEYWNDQAGPKWVRYQEVLDRQIAVHGNAMLDRAGLQPGERVLDIGCGCGGTTLEVARRVGPAGSVAGLDISAPMLEHARSRSAREGLAHVAFLQADAQIHALPQAAFDAAVSRFGVMFFAEPAAAFANVRRSIRANGRITFVCWRAVSENPWVTLPMLEAARFVELPPPPPADDPGPFAFAERDRVHRILSQAGFRDISIDAHDSPMRMGSSPDIEAAVELTFAIGPLSRLFAQADESIRPALRDAVRTALAAHLTPEGVILPSASWIVHARNA
jgi:SAM-dependent methyltransferase